MPAHAYRYALPEAVFYCRARDSPVTASMAPANQYVTQQASQTHPAATREGAWLTAHLGNGCSSFAARADGRSRDTAWGLTPLEGLVMGTRSGDVDPNRCMPTSGHAP